MYVGRVRCACSGVEKGDVNRELRALAKQTERSDGEF